MSKGPHIPRNKAVRSFLTGLFDYAGMYPPASLSFESAWAEYTAYLAGPDRWMMGPFVCGLSSLESLASISTRSEPAPPVHVSLVASRAGTAGEVGPLFCADLQRASELTASREDAISLDVVEVRLPSDAADTPESFRSLVDGMATCLEELPLQRTTVFLELTRDQRFGASILNACSALRTRSGQRPVLGLKLRCGGMRATDFPSPEEVAEFIHSVVENRILFKTTAGLHHPVRHWNASQNLMMHGFLNLFFATVLHAVHSLDMASLVRIIEDEDPEAFSFDGEQVRWRSLSGTVDELDHVRHVLATSIGSCSFDEPREDLVHLGWLDGSD